MDGWNSPSFGSLDVECFSFITAAYYFCPFPHFPPWFHFLLIVWVFLRKYNSDLFSLQLKCFQDLHMPAGYDPSSNQLHSGTTWQCHTPYVFVLGLSMDALGQDAKETRWAPMYVGPQITELFRSCGVSLWPVRMGAEGWVIPSFTLSTLLSSSQQCWDT